MNTYDIKRWDAVIFGNGTVASPMIYVKPDKHFLDFAEKNNNTIVCTIKNSNTPFDDYQVAGYVYKSSDIPNYRPNFFKVTGYYVIVLFANWIKYPNPRQLGTISIESLPEVENKINREKFKLDSNVSQKNSYSTSELIAISIALFVFF